MTTPPRDQLAADYAQHRATAIAMQRQLQTISTTATSANGLVTVTLGPQGEIRTLAFGSRAYREMAPAELAHAIVDTIERARDGMRRQILDMLPVPAVAGTTFEDILQGRVDWTSLLPEHLVTDGVPYVPAPHRPRAS
jgi:DNA-binding protein YbaB